MIASVVFGSGEGAETSIFDPRQLPALAAGWVRDYFLLRRWF